MYSVSDICDVFFNLEEKYDLNYLEIQGCIPWPLLRLGLFFRVTRSIQLLGSGQQQTLSIMDKFKSFIPFVKNSLVHSPFQGQTKDVLIFDHSRKVKFENEYVDIYTYFIVNYLKNSSSVEVVEFPYFNKHFTVKKDYIKYSDKIELGLYIYKKFNKVEFTQEEKDIISMLEKEIKSAFNVEVDLFSLFELQILNFKYSYKKYTELFLKKKPKKILIVVAYDKKAIVAAAKDLGIPVFELQHGTISKYHLGYSYPEKSRKEGFIPYFPDKILTFGEYWIDERYCPISKDNIVPIGFPYLQYQSKEFKSIDKKPNQILFISQGVIGSKLSESAYQFACNMPDYDIIYKLHPGEYESWKTSYPKLSEASKLDNFQVLKGEIPLYQLFAESTYQVGVCSTAIYEGLMFNCKTFIFSLPCSEYMDDLIEKGYVFEINDVKELINNINTFEPTNYDGSYFFKDFDKKLLDKVMDDE